MVFRKISKKNKIFEKIFFGVKMEVSISQILPGIRTYPLFAPHIL